jgi:hypothetical protein
MVADVNAPRKKPIKAAPRKSQIGMRKQHGWVGWGCSPTGKRERLSPIFIRFRTVPSSAIKRYADISMAGLSAKNAKLRMRPFVVIRALLPNF